MGQIGKPGPPAIGVNGLGNVRGSSARGSPESRSQRIRGTLDQKFPIAVMPSAEQAVRRLLIGRRLPEPLYWADRMSKDEV